MAPNIIPKGISSKRYGVIPIVYFLKIFNLEDVYLIFLILNSFFIDKIALSKF